MKSLTIIETNRPGMLAEITTLLEGSGVNVRDINGDIAGTMAIISIRAEPLHRCHRTLADAGFKVLSSEHLLARIKDQPGALADLSRSLANAQLDIRSIHIVSKDEGQCIVALEVDDPYRARQLMHNILVRDIE